MSLMYMHCVHFQIFVVHILHIFALHYALVHNSHCSDVYFSSILQYALSFQIMGYISEGNSARRRAKKPDRPDHRDYSQVPTNVEEAMTNTDAKAYKNKGKYIY